MVNNSSAIEDRAGMQRSGVNPCRWSSLAFAGDPSKLVPKVGKADACLNGTVALVLSDRSGSFGVPPTCQEVPMYRKADHAGELGRKLIASLTVGASKIGAVRPDGRCSHSSV